MSYCKEVNRTNSVSALINKFDSTDQSNKKPKIAKKPAKIINGRLVWIKPLRTDYDNCDSDLCSSLHSSGVDRSDSDSGSDFSTVSKLDSITNECVNFIQLVLKSLSNLMEFKTALIGKFQDNKDVNSYLVSVFRDVQPLQMLYDIILDKITQLKSKGSFCLPDLFLDKEVRASLNIYKTFLCQYQINTTWMGEFMKSNTICQDVCQQVKQSKKMGELVTPDSCLYTIFNSLFSFELIINRFSQMFPEGHESRHKAQEVKSLISGLLNIINNNQDQDNFLLTHKELNLILGRCRDPKLSSRFICKIIATKLSRRDGKALSRQLVLFSDCLYVTLIPSSYSGASSVRQELSLDSMKISTLTEEDEDKSNYKWGINISAREAQMEFYFDDEATLNMWINKLQIVIDNEMSVRVTSPDNCKTGHISKLGKEAPRWQKDSAANYCNGVKCSLKFSSTVRRHHCRADGLLYCDTCCSDRVKLQFERTPESRVCHLCYEIVSKDLNEKDETFKLLESIFERKTRKGRKLDWISEQIYNADKNSFSPPLRYFCELDNEHPFLNLYEKHEDKIKHHGIMLLGMRICMANESKKHSKLLKDNQFIIEHEDKLEAYIIITSNEEIRNQWVSCLKESIIAYRNEEMDK